MPLWTRNTGLRGFCPISYRISKGHCQRNPAGYRMVITCLRMEAGACRTSRCARAWRTRRQAHRAAPVHPPAGRARRRPPASLRCGSTAGRYAGGSAGATGNRGSGRLPLPAAIMSCSSESWSANRSYEVREAPGVMPCACRRIRLQLVVTERSARRIAPHRARPATGPRTTHPAGDGKAAARCNTR